MHRLYILINSLDVGGLRLVDFNDLFVIAVGILMAYIVVSRKHNGEKRERTFFTILSNMAKSVQLAITDYSQKTQNEEVNIVTKLEFFLASGKLTSETYGALKLVSDNARDVLTEVDNVKEWVRRKLNFHTKTEFLHVISFVCLLFGIYVLFIGAFQNKCDLDCTISLQWMMLAILVSLLHCLIYEKIGFGHDSLLFRWLKPNIYVHGAYLMSVVAFAYFYDFGEIIHVQPGWLAVLSVIACFIGFIAYFFIALCSIIIMLTISIRKIIHIDIKRNVEKQKKDIERFKDDLVELEKQFNEQVNKINENSLNISTLPSTPSNAEPQMQQNNNDSSKASVPKNKGLNASKPTASKQRSKAKTTKNN